MFKHNRINKCSVYTCVYMPIVNSDEDLFNKRSTKILRPPLNLSVGVQQTDQVIFCVVSTPHKKKSETGHNY